MDLSIGHGCLHQLLTRARDDCHTLRDDLQLALGLALTLDYHSQAWVSSLGTLGELHELSHSELDLTLLWSCGLGGSGRGLSRSCGSRAGGWHRSGCPWTCRCLHRRRPGLAKVQLGQS